ncbi:hypothetical protein QCD79_32445, partial [Pseudomonas quasicaspiana]|nr:hypothetical protein [Pseudomonas quasicaspiana]
MNDTASDIRDNWMPSMRAASAMRFQAANYRLKAHGGRRTHGRHPVIADVTGGVIHLTQLNDGKNAHDCG